MQDKRISITAKITLYVLMIVTILCTNAFGWTGTFIIYLFNSDGFTVPQGAYAPPAMDDGLWFETWLKQIATGDTSRHEGPGSPGFDYTYVDYGGGVYYGWIPITLNNYKKWTGSVWEHIDYADGDTIFFIAQDMEEPFIGECNGTPTCSCPGETLFWVFTDSTILDSFTFIDTLCPTVGIKALKLELPESYFQNQNHPNPFNTITTIQYGLPEAAVVQILIYNILGERVKVLVNGYQEAGYRRVMWDGTDDNHRKLESGLYLCRMETGEFMSTKKIILMK